MKKIAALAALTAACFIAGFMAPHKKMVSDGIAEAENIKDYEASTTVKNTDIEERIVQTGVVRYRSVYKLHAAASGRILSIDKKEADRVSPGDVIAVLENEELHRQRDTAASHVLQAEQALSDYSAYIKAERICAIDQNFDSIREKFETSQAAAENAAHSYELGMISSKELARLQHEYQAAQNLYSVQKTRKEYALEKEADYEKELIKAVNDKKKELLQIENEIASLQVRAPVVGVIIELSKNLPNSYWKTNMASVSKGQFIAAIADETGRYIETKLFGQDIVRIRQGSCVEVYHDGQELPPMRGVVSEISPAGIPYGQYYQYPVSIEVPDNSESLVPNALVTCKFIVMQKTNVPALPIEYIFVENGSIYCKTKKDGRVSRREISTGIDDGRHVEVISGIRAGEEIVH